MTAFSASPPRVQDVKHVQGMNVQRIVEKMDGLKTEMAATHASVDQVCDMNHGRDVASNNNPINR